MELFCQYSKEILTVDYIRKKFPLQMFDWVPNKPLRCDTELVLGLEVLLKLNLKGKDR